MFGIGTTELLIVLAILLLLFGGSRLAQLGSSLGKGIRNFRKSLGGDGESEKPNDPPRPGSGAA